MNDELEQVRRVAITGHVRPDGDCTGSTMGIYNYILDNFSGIEADVYLEKPGREFSFMPHIEQVKSEYHGESYDLLIVCDCGAVDRFEPFSELVKNCGRIICFDHHVGNSGFADEACVIEDYSSTCELLFRALDEDMITVRSAACLFTGLVTDTGSFKYQAVTPESHDVAARLMKKGINHTAIMDSCLSTRTFNQNKVIGSALLRSRLLCENRVIVSSFSYDEMQEYHVQGKDMGVVIDQLRTTEGTEAAVFLYELNPGEYKVSMRARDYLDVSRICRLYGGGGHVRAAGCTIHGTAEEIIRMLAENLQEQFKEHDNV
jgi:phosphoesterase RecJ-like protein